MKKNVLSILIVLLCALHWQGNAQVSIGNDMAITYETPILAYYEYSYTQQIYPQSDIYASGNISSISFYYISGDYSNSNNWKIYLGHTTKNEFYTPTDWVLSSSLTEVFNGAVTFPSEYNWMTITFDTPFFYNNIDNLVVVVDENKTGTDSTLRFGGSPSSMEGYSTITTGSPFTNPDPEFPPNGISLSNYTNNIILGGIQQSCPYPANIFSNDVTPSSIKLNWTEEGIATQWEVISGLYGFDPETEGTTTNVTTNSTTTFNGLLQGTYYDFYVRAVCGTDDKSILKGPVTVSTSCYTSVPVPYKMDFDHTPNLDYPTCTTRENVGMGNNWLIADIGEEYGYNDSTLFYQYTNASADAWFFTQGVDLAAGTVYEISYQYGNYGESTSEKMKVAYGTSPTSTAMSELLADYPNISGERINSEIIVFSPLSSGTYYFGFNVYSDAYQELLFLDEINVDVAPSCPQPRNLTVTNITEDSADLSWETGWEETAWEVAYDSNNFDPDTEGTIIDVITSPETTLAGLAPNAVIRFYVRAKCGPGVESIWVGPKTFRLSCSPGTVPFADSFEDGYVNEDILGDCWSQESIDGNDEWLLNSTRTSRNRSPRNGSFNISLNDDNESWIYYPMNLTSGTAYELRFYARQDGVTGASVEAAFGDLNDVTAMTNSILPSSPVVNGEYQEFVGIFTPPDSGIYYIGIKATLNSDPYYLSMDDISVQELGSCPRPRALTASNITDTSADISWSSSGIETEWNVAYGSIGFDPNIAGTSITVSPNTSTILNELDPNTTYNVYVKAVCDPGDKSSWLGPISFTTPCTPATIPFSEGFESGYINGLDLGDCWSQESIESSEKWTVNSSETSYNRNPRTGSFNIYLFPENEDWIFYPLNLTEGTPYQLKFYARQNSNIGTTVSAAYGISNNGAAMTTPIIASSIVIGGGYQEFNGTFSPPTSGTYYIGIKTKINSDSNYVSLDDITVQEITGCVQPNVLNIANLTSNSVNFNWSPIGSETAWEVAYASSGFDPNVTGTIVNITTSPSVVLSGLDDNETYDLYVRAVCGENDKSAFAGPLNFRTPCTPTSVPYLIDFEDSTTPNLPSCTTKENTGNGNEWETSQPFESGFNNTALTYEYDSNSPASTWFYTQAIDLLAGTYYEISYLYGCNGYDENLKIAYGNYPEESQMTHVLAEYVEFNHEALEGTTIFTVPTDGIYYFGFQAYSSPDQYNLYLDDIKIDLAPSCPAPSQLSVSNITTFSAEASWNVGLNENNWHVVYGPSGFDPITEGITLDETSNLGTIIVGLDDSTAYDIYIKAICDNDDESSLVGPLSFSTSCSPVGLPYTMDFETSNVPDIPLCTTKENAGDGNEWITIEYEENGFNSTVLSYEYDSNHPANTWFYTQGIELVSGNLYQISYLYGCNGYDENLKIAYGSAPIASEMTTELANYFEFNYDATLGTVVFAVPSDGVYYFGFQAYSAEDEYNIYVDDITIENYTGYIYKDEAWTPEDPSGVSLTSSNILVINGTGSLTADTDVNNITIESGATLEIHNILNLNGTITNNGNLVFVSNASGNGELAAVAAPFAINGEVTIQNYMSNHRSYRMVSSSVFTPSSIHDNWQEGAQANSDDPNPGFGTHITGTTTDQTDGFDATATGNPSMFTVNIATQQFEAISNTDVTPLIPGEGYLLFVRGDRSIDLNNNNSASETVLRAKGFPAMGPGTLLYNTVNQGDFVMFGNPYPSAVDMNSVFGNAGTENVNTSFYYVYDPTQGTYGSYVTVNLPDGTNTGTSEANQYLQMGQGAQFATSGNGSSSLEFYEADKAPGNFTATSRPLTSNNMLTIQLYTSENFNSGGPTHDSFGIIFGEGLDNGITSADAVKPMNFYENLGINNNGTYLSIERRDMPQIGEVYHLYSTGYKYSTYTMKMTIDGLENSLLYLDDHFTDISTQLEAGDNTYSFSVEPNDPLSIATDRFSIRNEQRLGVDDNSLLSVIRLFPNPLNGNTFYINAPMLNGKQLSVSIRDLSGRRIFNQTLECRSNTITVPMAENISSGVYMVTLKYGGETHSYKLIKE